MIEKEWKKGGKCLFFPQFEKTAYFFPNWLKIYKIAQKKDKNIQNCNKKDWHFSPVARTPSL